MTADQVFSCREIVEMVSDYVEGDLDADTAIALEAHFGVCPGCLRYVEQVRETIAVVGRVSSENLPPDAQAGLVEAFRSFRRPAAGT